MAQDVDHENKASAGLPCKSLPACPFCGAEPRKAKSMKNLWKIKHFDGCFFPTPTLIDKFDDPKMPQTVAEQRWNQRAI